jgi:hypothetical protein
MSRIDGLLMRATEIMAMNGKTSSGSASHGNGRLVAMRQQASR